MIVNLHLLVYVSLLLFVYLAFSREELRKLFLNLNKQKDKLKKMGIKVDGKHYRIRFKGTGSEKKIKIPLLIIISSVIGDTYLCTLKYTFPSEQFFLSFLT